MYRMTGFGRGEFSENGLNVYVELKSVNNRFLDLTLKLPHLLSSFEDVVRDKIKESLSRGHVDVYVSLLDKREKSKTLYVDLSAANAYMEAAGRLKVEFPTITNDFTLTALMKAPDVLTFEENRCPDEAIQTGLFEALSKALENLKAMRSREGNHLKEEILGRVKRIEELREEIASRAPLIAEEYRSKLTERMTEFLGGKVDESRILTEAALFADKCNIDEELTRLSSHIAEFRKICEEETAGRKLDFLIQEFNRECNTVCSKSNDSLITKSALEMKNEIEKVREQIQNIE